MNRTPEPTLLELIGTTYKPDDATPDIVIEWSPMPEVILHENMKFHFEHEFPYLTEEQRLVEVEEFMTHGNSPFDRPINGDRIWMLTKALDKALPLGFTGFIRWSKRGLDDDGYPTLEISVWRNDPAATNGVPIEMPADTPESKAIELMWPAYATLVNITDPGTFNSPYLFAGF